MKTNYIYLFLQRNLSGLKELCEAMLIGKLQTDNGDNLLKHANKLNLPKLRELANEYTMEEY